MFLKKNKKLICTIRTSEIKNGSFRKKTQKQKKNQKKFSKCTVLYIDGKNPGINVINTKAKHRCKRNFIPFNRALLKKAMIKWFRNNLGSNFIGFNNESLEVRLPKWRLRLLGIAFIKRE